MVATDLEDLAPAPIRVRAGGESIDVLPLTVGQIPPLARTLKGIDLDFSNVFGLLEAHGERLVEAVALCINRPVEWVGALPADEFIELAAHVLEVNAHFFGRRVLPAVNQLMATLVAGFGSSSASSPMVTD